MSSVTFFFKTGSLVILCLISSMTTFAQPTLKRIADDIVMYMPLPPGIDREDVLSGSQQVKNTLRAYSLARLRQMPADTMQSHIDMVVIYTDRKGRAILPERDRSMRRKTGSAREMSNELTYTFNSPDYPFTAEELTTLQTYIHDFYPVIKSIVGAPLFNITVNVTKDPTISLSGLYYSSTNEMVLKNALHPDVICHESIHAFRDDYIMSPGTYEEGITRATEVAVFNELPSYAHDDKFHSYDIDVFYEGLNKPQISALGANINGNDGLRLMRYQISSYVWAKAYIEDNSFLRRFNDSLYNRIETTDPYIAYDPMKLKGMFANIKPTMEGVATSDWLSRQYILNTEPVLGYQLYQRLNDFVIFYLKKESAGIEQPQPGSTVSWKILDYQDQLMQSGSNITNGYGSVMFDPGFSGIDYDGRIKMVASTSSPDGPVNDTVFRTFLKTSGDAGIFGVVEDSNSGSVSITPLDTAMETFTQPIVKGAFVFDNLELVKGRFLCVFAYPDGSSFSRIYTKDRSRYFISFSAETLFPLPLRLVDFSATYRDGAAGLQWHTAEEQNTGRFVIERSVDGTRFNSIGSIEAAHHSDQVTSYSFSDAHINQLNRQTVYYRLRQEDQDGRITLSKVVAVRLTYAGKPVISPNPALNTLTISLPGDFPKTDGIVSITDAIGRRIFMRAMTLTGNQVLTVPLNGWTAGIYYLSIDSKYGKVQMPFLKVRQ